MRLEVVTPAKKLLEAEVDEVTAPGSAGEFGVLPGHVPMLSGLKPGVVAWHGSQGRGALAVAKGFVQVLNDRIIVLVDAGAKPEDVDIAEAQRELAASVKQVEAAGEDAGARTHALEQRDWAQARVDLVTATRH